ncbi:MAG: YopJ family acetyltransferase [Candidatus Malihini olakiniferum]
MVELDSQRSHYDCAMFSLAIGKKKFISMTMLFYIYINSL